MKTKNTRILSSIKILLAIIAFNLTFISISQFNIWPNTVHANDLGLDPNINYGIVPLNEDGSINVNLNSSNVMDINIAEVNGYEVPSYDEGHLGVYLID